MTYQEKIETLCGVLCDYHDVCDNQPDCFACDEVATVIFDVVYSMTYHLGKHCLHHMLSHVTLFAYL